MHERLTLRVAAWGLLLCLLPIHAALADELYGRIRGKVTDPSGAVIAGVRITATNTDTGIAKTVTAGPDGAYEFLQLAAPGVYKVSAEQSGFARFEATDVHLSLDQIYILNIAMVVGTVTQAVTVEANAAQIEITSMQLGRNLSASQIVDLPLNGRNWIQLQQTLPGVVASDRFTDNYATNGSRSQSNDYLVNGTDANDLALNNPLVIPSPDAIAEVSLVTNTINPEYGRNGGAILNATTKTGTNAFHGDGFEFFRDTSLNTRNFFNPKATVFHQNQYGGTIGGPIKRDKAFFFFSYQGTRNARPESAGACGGCTPGTATVFTDAERGGDFSADGALSGVSPFPLVGENGTTYPALTPYSTIFPTGHVPLADLNPVALGLMNKYVPRANASGNLFEFNPTETNTFNQYLSRIDYNLTEKDSLWGYMFIEPSRTVDPIPFFAADIPGFPEFDTERIQHYTLAWTHTFSGNTFNEARFGYNRFNFHAVEPLNPVLPSSLGFTGIIPQAPGVAGVPSINISGGPSLGQSPFGPQPRIDQTYQVTDNLSKIIGRHTTKFGFEMRRSEVDNPLVARNSGVFTFSGGGTYTTGIPNADFLLGIPDSYVQQSGGLDDTRTQTYYSFAQDQFKLRQNFTLTYGVGWQIDTPLNDIFNGGLSTNCFKPGRQSTVFPTAPVGLTFPGDTGCNSAGGATTHYTHVAPRVGFAWSPGQAAKWAIRGGFGIYYDRTEEELAFQNVGAPPFSITSAGIGDVGGSPSFAAPFTDISTGQTVANKFPFTPPKKGAPVDWAFFEPLSLNLVDPNFDVPYTMNYNLTIERQLPGSTIFSVAYVGLLGRKLTNTIELNPAGSEAGNPVCLATPGCNSFNSFVLAPQTYRYPQVNAGGALIFASLGQQATFINSSYNAFQATLEKRAGHGLSFRAAYSYSHSLDGSSSFEDLGFSGVRGLDPFNPRANYGDSAYDARQRLVVSYTYNLPSIRHFSSFERFPSRLTDGWSFDGISTFQTGIPVTIGDSAVRSFTCDASFEFYSCWDRPNAVAPLVTTDPRTSTFNNSLHGTRPPRGPKDHYWFDPNSFGREAVGTIGNSGRNFFHGPGINNFDFALHKDTRITETTRLQLRFEFFNFFNHAQFTINGVSSDSGSSNFGRVQSANNPNGSRVIQLAAKFYF